MKLIKVLLPSLALGAAAMVLAPEQVQGFATNGSSLGLSQRDFRIFNDFADAEANNNLVPDPSFPGYQGAVMAIWKGCVEWQSEWHAGGLGDPYQGNLIGSGQANFDPSFQGEALGVGGLNSNIISPLNASNPGVYAFAEGPYSDGWRVRFYQDPWIWKDGPGNNGGSDLQGIACHEYGHCIGLGHSVASGNPTMQSATATGLEQRSINFDDVDGVQAVYGVKSGSKPRITDVAVDTVNDTVTITGVNFSQSNNEVWFTQGTAGGTGAPVKQLGVGSTGGGTSITVDFPGNSGPGDILVRVPGSAFSDLSNAWPVDPGGVIPPGGSDPPTINSISPTSLEAVIVDPTLFFVTVNGSNFVGTTSVEIDGVPHPMGDVVITDSQILILNWPLVSTIGLVDIEIVHPNGNAVTQIQVDWNDPPVIEVANSLPSVTSSTVPLEILMGSKPGDIMFLAFSGSSVPSVLPGYVAYNIGNNFAQLFNGGTYVTPTSGYTKLNINLTGGGFAGVTLYYQCAVLPFENYPDNIWPLVMTNFQGTFFIL